MHKNILAAEALPRTSPWELRALRKNPLLDFEAKNEKGENERKNAERMKRKKEKRARKK